MGVGFRGLLLNDLKIYWSPIYLDVSNGSRTLVFSYLLAIFSHVRLIVLALPFSVH